MSKLLLLIGCALTASAGAAPVQIYLSDPHPVSFSLDEPATGCALTGTVVHPVAQPAERVIWFTERVCGQHKTKVSYVSGILNAPDGVIHKGEKLHITPANVKLLQTSNL